MLQSLQYNHQALGTLFHGFWQLQPILHSNVQHLYRSSALALRTSPEDLQRPCPACFYAYRLAVQQFRTSIQQCSRWKGKACLLLVRLANSEPLGLVLASSPRIRHWCSGRSFKPHRFSWGRVAHLAKHCKIFIGQAYFLTQLCQGITETQTLIGLHRISQDFPNLCFCTTAMLSGPNANGAMHLIRHISYR